MDNKETIDRERLIDTREAAEMLAKHHTVLGTWRHEGRGPRFVRMGRSIRYRVGDLYDWIATNTVDPGAG